MVVVLARVTNKFCEVWSHFEVWLWWMSDKRDESTWRGQIMLMMSQIPNGRSNAIGLDQDLVWLEVANLESKEKNWKMTEELKNHILQFRMTVQIGSERGINCNEKNGFCTTVRNFAWSYETIQKATCCYCSCWNFAWLCKNDVLVWNDPSSCEMVILMLNSKFLNLESSRRLMWSCQVSIWT